MEGNNLEKKKVNKFENWKEVEGASTDVIDCDENFFNNKLNDKEV